VLDSTGIANCEVDDTSENGWGHDGEWELRDNLCPEVWRHLVHVIVYFPEEDRSLVWEDEDNILDSVESDVHRDEEKGTSNVLKSSCVSTGVEEQEDGEKGSQTSSEKLDIGGLWKSKQVEEVSSAEKTELVAETGCGTTLIWGTHVKLLDTWGLLSVIVP